MEKGIATTIRLFPEDKVKIRLLAIILDKPQVVLFNEMIDDLWQKHKDNPVVVSKKVDRKLSLDMKKMLKHILEQAVEKKQN